MNKYLATVKISGRPVKTAVFADSAIHARLLLQYQYGLNCLVAIPALATLEKRETRAMEQQVGPALATAKTIKPKPPKQGTIKPVRPMDANQLRVDSLKKAVQRDREALSNERENQRRQRNSQA